MRLNDSEFETEVSEGVFGINITQETDLSLDGGHTFEVVTGTFDLNRQTAKDLLLELQEYLSE